MKTNLVENKGRLLAPTLLLFALLIILFAMPLMAASNSITSFTATAQRDGNILVSISCATATMADMSIVAYDGGTPVALVPSSITCGTIQAATLLLPAEEIENGKVYVVTATISAPCDACKKSAYIPWEEESKEPVLQIPDNNAFLVLVLVALVGIIISVKRRSSKKSK